MSSFIKFIIPPLTYGLSIAFIINFFFPLQSFSSLSPHYSQQQPHSYAEAVRKAAPAVVNIYSFSMLNTPSFLRRNPTPRRELGSGIIMNAEGYILTNYHVVNGAEQIQVALQDGRILEAVLIGKDQLTDLALLKITADNLPVIPQQETIISQVGDVVLALGNPLNLGLTTTHGIISAVEKKFTDSNYLKLLQMDAAINKGNSGGALINSLGVLVGINTSSFQTSDSTIQGIFFAVPYNTAIKVMTKLIQDGRVIRGYMGVTGIPVNHLGQDVLSSLDAVAGMRLTGISPNSPAFKAGLKVNDILLSVAGKQISSLDELLTFIEEAAPDSELEFMVYRENKQYATMVVIEEL